MTLRGLAFCALALACGCETFDSPVTDGGVDASGRLDGGDAFDAPATPDGDSVKDAGNPSLGCADGTREGFLDVRRAPGVAACGGAWEVPGMDAEIACDRASGSTDHPAGRGCAAADLCSVGWHVCKNGAELSAQNGDCGTLEADGFFATQQPASGGVCAGGGNDDVFGCMRGAVGANLANAVCQPLNAVMSTTTALPGWNLGTNPINERLNATKQNLLGGVLCCKG